MYWAVLFVTLGYGALGFADDYLKLSRQNHKGVSARMKLLAQTAIGLIAAIWLMLLTRGPLGSTLTVPVFKEVLIPLGFLFPLFGMLVMLGASNAVNLTDGLDGLAIVPTIICAGVFALIAYLVGNRIFADYLQLNAVPGVSELPVFCSALIGAGLGFLWFNAPPAAVFMGDTGSLALGGALGAVAVATKHEIVLVHRRRPVRGGDRVGHRTGVLVQAHRQPRLPDGAAAPSFREEGLGRTNHRDPVLDHLDDPRAGRSGDAEDPMSTLSRHADAGRHPRLWRRHIGKPWMPPCVGMTSWGALSRLAPLRFHVMPPSAEPV